MKFYLLTLVHLLIFSVAQAETVLSWNSSTYFSNEQLCLIKDQILLHNPDLVCLRSENISQLEPTLFSSYTYLFYDQGLLIASKTPITNLQYSSLSQDEGVLEFVAFDNHIYIPIIQNSTDDTIWKLAYEKIWNDHDPFSLVCTHLNRVNSLQRVTAIFNSQYQTLLAGGPVSTNFSVTDSDGNTTVEASGTYSTETSGGGKVDVEVSGGVSKDQEGTISKEASISITFTP